MGVASATGWAVSPAPEYLTSTEVATLLRRSPKTVRNRAARLRLERKIILVGRPRRHKVMLLPPASVAALRAYFWGFKPKPVKKIVSEPT